MLRLLCSVMFFALLRPQCVSANNSIARLLAEFGDEPPPSAYFERALDSFPRDALSYGSRWFVDGRAFYSHLSPGTNGLSQTVRREVLTFIRTSDNLPFLVTLSAAIGEWTAKRSPSFVSEVSETLVARLNMVPIEQRWHLLYAVEQLVAHAGRHCTQMGKIVAPLASLNDIELDDSGLVQTRYLLISVARALGSNHAEPSSEEVFKKLMSEP